MRAVSNVARACGLALLVAGCATTSTQPRELTVADMDFVNAAGEPEALDLARYFPDVAVRREVSGRASIRCSVMSDRTLHDCAVISESPPGFRFGEQTIRVASRMRVKPGLVIAPGQSASIAINWIWPH